MSSRSVRGRRLPWGTLLVALVALVAVALQGTGGTHASYTAAFAHPGSSVQTVGDYNQTELPLRDAFAGGMAGWTTHGGVWSARTTQFGYGVMTETGGGPDGPKAVAGNPAWTDYTLQGDVQVLSGTQAGFVFRVTSASTGADAFDGYYAGVDASDSSLVLRRMDGSATPLARQRIVSGVTSGDSGNGSPFYHVVVEAAGCTFTVRQTTVGANTWTSLTYTDPAATCRRSGAVGLRDQDSTAGFRYVSVTEGPGSPSGVLPWNSTLATSSLNDGPAAATYGGSWSFSPQEETIRDTADQGVGDKQVLNRSWGDLTMTGDVRMMRTPDDTTDVGFAVRVTGAGAGLDNLHGYVAALRGSRLVVGRVDGATPWTSEADAPLERPVRRGEWWHLTVSVVGCTVTAAASPSAGGTVVRVVHDAGPCDTTAGAVAVRERNTEAEWRNLAVTAR